MSTDKNVVGNTITADGESLTYTISGNTLSLSGSQVDDEDDDGNSTETYIMSMTFTKVTSPTVAELAAIKTAVTAR